ncbi:MAG: glycosyltransferase [Verrucomicrobiota bacterium]
MSIRSLIIVSHGYPCNKDGTWFPFVQQFAHAVARQGVRVSVIAPLPFHLAIQGRDSWHSTEAISAGAHVDVYRPKCLSLSCKQFLCWNTEQLGLRSFYRATKRVLRTTPAVISDVIYGHFLYRGGQAAVRLGKELHLPAFPMVGEHQLVSVQSFGFERARRHFSTATGFMANSKCLGRLLQQHLGIAHERIGIFPNGIDHRKFYSRDRNAMRKKLGLPQEGFIVICVAKQDLQKGPSRVGEAIQKLEGVSGVFLGSGIHPPQADNIIQNGSVPHDQVPEWLSAADVFVLPSTYEGSCNAILEAMACGLPVVSSTGDFNDDILNDNVSIRVDPLDVSAIREAIVRLRDDPGLRQKMSRAALAWAPHFDIDRRARRILDYMESMRQPAHTSTHGGSARSS